MDDHDYKYLPISKPRHCKEVIPEVYGATAKVTTEPIIAKERFLRLKQSIFEIFKMDCRVRDKARSLAMTGSVVIYKLASTLHREVL